MKLAERIRQRKLHAEEYLAGRPVAARSWAKFNLALANTADRIVTGMNHPTAAAVIGFGEGIVRGIMIGTIIGIVATLVPPFAHLLIAPFTGLLGVEFATSLFGTVVSGMLAGGAVLGVRDSYMGYNEAQADSGEIAGAKLGDRIARRGGAIAPAPSKATADAVVQMAKNKELPPPEEPHPDPPENQKFLDKVAKSKEVEKALQK